MFSNTKVLIRFFSWAFLLVPCLLCAFTIDQTKNLKLVVPKRSLNPGALEIRYKTPSQSWDELYTLTQKVAAVFWSDGPTHYLVHRKQTPKEKLPKYHIVPFSPKSSLTNYDDRYRVLTRIFLGNTWHTHSKKDRKKIAESFKKAAPLYITAPPVNLEKGDDPFCKKLNVARQLLYEGDHTFLLLDYAPFPLTKEELHFLVIPKNHKELFSDLSVEEFTEAHQIADAVFAHFSSQYPTYKAHFIHKSGKLAMQEVPHWHLHVIFEPKAAPPLNKKLLLLWRAIFKCRLPVAELSRRVQMYADELNDPNALFQSELKQQKH